MNFMNNEIILSENKIENMIFTIRGVQVMLDSDLAELYEVPVFVLNQAVRRNIKRFPERFRFQLNKSETNELITNCDRFKKLKHSSVFPHVYTESGVAMLSTILRSEIAITVSIKIMDAFVFMRKTLSHIGGVIQRLENVEFKQIETDKKIDNILNALESKTLIPKCGVFFDGQIFDAYVLANQIIKSAQKSITLIDNFVDEVSLTILSKKTENVDVLLLTRDITNQLKLDILKFNQQYPNISAKLFYQSHDRFLIIDDTEVYHLGASLKDLGNKWFAFSKLDKSSVESLLNKVTRYT